MRGVRPVYLVTKFKRVPRQARANRYTGAHELEDLWKVGFIHGQIPGISMNFYFEAEQQARAFSLWEIYDPSKIIKGMAPDEPFIAQDVIRWPTTGLRNAWTGMETRGYTWEVPFKAVNTRRRIHLRFPDEPAARKYRKSRTYKIQDLFGTLPAASHDISMNLQNKVLQAKEAQAAADVANARLVNAQAQHDQILATAQQGVLTIEAEKAEVEGLMQFSTDPAYLAILAADLSDLQTELAAALALVLILDNAVPPAVQPPPAPGGTTFISRSFSALINDPTYGPGRYVTDHWWITNGGAAGYYHPGAYHNNQQVLASEFVAEHGMGLPDRDWIGNYHSILESN